jgi:uncharacterized membrane protein
MLNRNRNNSGVNSGTRLALSLLIMAGGAVELQRLMRKRSQRLAEGGSGDHTGRAQSHGAQDAPERALREKDPTGARKVGRTVTVARPRDEVYAAWRDVGRFPEFMENVESIEPLDDMRSRWTVAGPGGKAITFTSVITQDEPGELIAWSAEDDADIANSGRITFRDAPGGRGTEVDLTISYRPLGGAIGVAVAKMFQRDPGIQARRDLRRFKQRMETGEISTSDMRPSHDDDLDEGEKDDREDDRQWDSDREPGADDAAQPAGSPLQQASGSIDADASSRQNGKRQSGKRKGAMKASMHAEDDGQGSDLPNPGPRDPAVDDPEEHDPDVRNPGVHDPDVNDPDIKDPPVRDPGGQDPDIQDPALPEPGTSPDLGDTPPQKPM